MEFCLEGGPAATSAFNNLSRAASAFFLDSLFSQKQFLYLQIKYLGMQENLRISLFLIRLRIRIRPLSFIWIQLLNLIDIQLWNRDMDPDLSINLGKDPVPALSLQKMVEIF